jgi:quercetin dioxygenase-like cupin family protein
VGNPRSRFAIGAAALVMCLVVSRSIDAQQSANSSRSAADSRVAISEALSRMDGNQLRATLVEVSYAPGGSSAPHSHLCPVFGYVVNGALRSQVKGEPEHIYKAGESFYEAANGLHQISANASATEPAKFVAFFICDHDTPLTVPAPMSKNAGGN